MVVTDGSEVGSLSAPVGVGVEEVVGGSLELEATDDATEDADRETAEGAVKSRDPSIDEFPCGRATAPPKLIDEAKPLMSP